MTELTDNQQEDLQGIIEVSKQWMLSKRIGSITFNFFKGGIANFVKNESVKINPNRKKTEVR